MDSNLSIVLADSHTLTRLGLSSLLIDNYDIDTVESDAFLFQFLEYNKPDLLIIDYDQEGYFSADSIYRIRQESPELKILVISNDRNKVQILKVLEAGINGYLTRECDEEEILNGIELIVKNEKFFCNKIVDVILQKNLAVDDQSCSPVNLTEREIEITRLVADGMTSKKIADKLFLSFHTVHTHRKNIMKKLGIKTVSELTLYAINVGLVKLSE